MTPSQRLHTQQRLAQRYGLTVSTNEVFLMAKRIAHGGATLISKQSKQVMQCWLIHEGVALRLVYDRQQRSILTALPAEDSAAFLAVKADVE
jgi:1-aminocyclopropane-1-carboxylate deaminase/D-cysteine desulfhydrase-like pyridoxal-dependent ACC family enzyme